MSGRKLNALEQKIHQAALAGDERVRPTFAQKRCISQADSISQTIGQKELEALAPDRDARTAAINFLLGAGLLKVLKDSGGRLSFRAVVKKELDAYVIIRTLIK